MNTPPSVFTVLLAFVHVSTALTINWKLPFPSSDQVQTAKLGEAVNFIGDRGSTEQHALMLVSDQYAFDTCQLVSGTQVASITVPFAHTWTPTKPGDYYFADSVGSNCIVSGLKVKITVMEATSTGAGQLAHA